MRASGPTALPASKDAIALEDARTRILTVGQPRLSPSRSPNFYMTTKANKTSKSGSKNYSQSYSTAALARLSRQQDARVHTETSHRPSLRKQQLGHDRIGPDSTSKACSNKHFLQKKPQKSSFEAIRVQIQHQHAKKAACQPSKNCLRQTMNASTNPTQLQTRSEYRRESESRKAKSPQFNWMHRHLTILQKPLEEQAEACFPPKFLSKRTTSPKKGQSDAKMFFRQTLDPKIQINQNVLRYNLYSTLDHKKISKQASGEEKVARPEKTNKNATFSSGNFWKNRAVSPPSKPVASQKTSQDLSQLRIPPLPLPAGEKMPHRPSFFLNKKSLNRFSIVKQLGSGTFSDAFLCIDKKTATIYCLKRYHKMTLKSLPDVLNNFIKKTAFQLLAEHPNIVQLYDVFSEGEFIYTLEEFMEAGRLADLIHGQAQKMPLRHSLGATTASANLFSEAKIIDKLHDLCSGLYYIHQSREGASRQNRSRLPALAHGDVRTKSILVSLGVCKLPSIEPANTRPFNINMHSPPEQIIEQVYIPKSDVWNLGLVLFELCARRTLFSMDPLQGSKQGPKPGYQVFNVNIHEQVQKLTSTTQLLKDIIKKLLVIQPDDRPSSDALLSSGVFQMYGFDIRSENQHDQLPGRYSTKDSKSSQSFQALKIFRQELSREERRLIKTEQSQGQRKQPQTKPSTNDSEPPAKPHWTSKLAQSSQPNK